MTGSVTGPLLLGSAAPLCCCLGEDRARAYARAVLLPSRPSRPDFHRSWVIQALLVVLVGLALLWLAGSCRPGLQARSLATTPAAASNLLVGARLVRAQGVRHPERLADGVAAVEGDYWKTNLTSVIASGRSFVEYDLGEPKRISAVLLQGDNNDTYTVQVSNDGESYYRLWSAPRLSQPGLQTRTATGLSGLARYVRLMAAGGDGSYSLAEVALYAETPSPFPPRLLRLQGLRAEQGLRARSKVFAGGLIAFVLLTGRAAPIWYNLLCLLLPLFGAWEFARGLDEAWPPEQREISLLRGLMGLVAAVAVARELVLPRLLGWLGARLLSRRLQARTLAAESWCVLFTLSVSALLALACFGNLGYPQFWDHKLDQPSRVHNFDMRVYFPVAKYFHELRYDGLYQASVMAYVDDTPGLSLSGVGHITIRDLKTHEMTRVRDVEREIVAVKARFSPQRWQEFLTDMRYFRETMGLRDYLGSMHDHGGNATPVWMAVAHLIFAHARATNTTLLLGALLDPLLLLAAFVAIGRVFGVRTMLMAMVVFGANDYYMFGSNWAGATLRHDWMAWLGLGACALKRERWMLGGALLAWSALIRAFPALALLAVLLPAAWWAYDQYRANGRWPTVRSLCTAQRSVLRVMLGAALASVLLFSLSVVLLGFDAWLEWAHKIRLLATGPHVNHVSLRALIAYDPRYTFAGLQHAAPGTADWGTMQQRMLMARRYLYAALIVAYVLAVVFAARRKPLEQAAVLGLILIPIVFYPANYYAHFVYLLPLLAVERGRTESYPVTVPQALIWVGLGLMCAIQYYTVLVPDLDMHFNYASLVLVVTLAVVLALVLLGDRLALVRPKPLAVTGGSAAGPLPEVHEPQ